MKLLKTHPIKKPKDLKKSDRDKIEKLLTDNIHLLTKEEKRIYKKELKIEKLQSQIEVLKNVR